MIDDTDPVLDAVDALRAAGIAVAPIGDFLFSDADVLRLVESRRFVEVP